MSRQIKILAWLAAGCLILASLLFWLDTRQTQSAQPTVEYTVQDSKVVFGGIPRNISDPCKLQVLDNQIYVVGYCPKDGGSHWAAYHLGKVESLVNVPREPTFYPDKRVANPVTTQMYTRSGYDRGHMVPHYAIATHFPQQAASTFLLTNILPQKPLLNRGIWENLESLIARKYGQAYGDVWVINGPIYQRPAKTLANRIALPSAFYHMVFTMTNSGVRVMAFIFPQDVEPESKLEHYLTSVVEIQKRTGLDFCPEMSPEAQEVLENYIVKQIW